jgi:hypothetical protein
MYFSTGVSVKFINQLLLISLLLPSIGAGSVNASDIEFVEIKLPEEIVVQLPKGWETISSFVEEYMQFSINRAIDLSNGTFEKDDGVNILAAASLSDNTYASFILDVIYPPTVSQMEAELISNRDLKALEPIMENAFKEQLPYVGNKLIKYHGMKKCKISNYPAFVNKYLRTGPISPVEVEIYNIYKKGHEYRLTLSYRKTEKAKWKPVIDKIRTLVKIK